MKSWRLTTEHHLLAPTHIGPREHHPAMTEADMGNFYRRYYGLDQQNLVAPVELICLAGRKLKSISTQPSIRKRSKTSSA
ncbi:hypothetical protein N434_04633 [Rhizobium sp. UGM030330-04]|nr:hypothetical protein N434_04633 [Rhizobium sp. UGM030330-04]